MGAYREAVRFFLNAINPSAVEADEKANLFINNDLYPAVEKCKQDIKRIEKELLAHLLPIRKKFGSAYAKLEYKTVLTNEYLVEINVKDIAKVPSDWHKINA